MLGKEFFHRAIKIETVLLIPEAVAFVFLDHIRNINPACFKRFNDLVRAPALPAPVCDDPDDDKFLACALASKTGVIISGDRHPLEVSGYRGITIMKPREFADHYLETQS